jgi:hypothetical protein
MSLETQLNDERQQRVHRALVAGGPQAPARLRARVAAMQSAGRSSRPQARPLVLAAAAVLVGLITVLTLTLDGRSPGGPTLADAAQVSAREPTAPSPVHDLRRPALLRASFDGVPYPYWYGEFSWFAAGQRTDSLAGERTARTVFYRHTHHRIGYTVVSGKPLLPPRSAERRVINGLELFGYRDGDRDVVTFVRNGHTCVLAGMVHSRGTLFKLASWKGDGAVRF